MNFKIYVIIIALIIILVGGFVGNVLADNQEATCTLEITDHFCWKWKKFAALSPDNDSGEINLPGIP